MKFKIPLVLLISFLVILNSIPSLSDEKIEVDDSETSSSTSDKKVKFLIKFKYNSFIFKLNKKNQK